MNNYCMPVYIYNNMTLYCYTEKFDAVQDAFIIVKEENVKLV